MPDHDNSENPSPFDYYDDPLYLSTSDQPSTTLSSFLFEGHDFLGWKREVLMALVAKNKDGMIDGSCSCPPSTDKRHRQWKRCDFMVMRWISNSLDKNLKENFKFVTSSKELWDELTERFGQSNALEVYQLTKDLGAVSQENLSLVEYYSKMKNLWETLDSLDPLPSCTCGKISLCSCTLIKKMIDRNNTAKIIQFLMNLKASYDGIRTQILSLDPLPPINKVLALLQKIERQKQITDTVSVLTDANAYASYQQSDPKRSNDVGPSTVKHCDHCNKNGHTRATCFGLTKCPHCNKTGYNPANCFLIRGFPGDKNKGKEKVSYNKTAAPKRGANTADILPGSPLEESFSNAVEHSGNAAVNNNSGAVSGLTSEMLDGLVTSVIDQVSCILLSFALTANSSGFLSDWIVDTGASDHMTYDLKLLTDVHVFTKPVRNLLSVSKLLDSYHMTVVFSSTECVFQDLTSNHVIAKRRRIGDLYRFHRTVTQNVNSAQLVDNLRKLVLNKFLAMDKVNKNLHTVASSSSESNLVDLVPSMSGAKYFLKILDDFSRNTWTILFQHKDQGDCLLTATYLINLMPTPLIKNKTPYELLFNTVPAYDHLKVFGCLCYATMPPTFTDKFGSRARECIFIGYPHNQKGYRLYDLKLHKIFVSRDVTFQEKLFPFHKDKPYEDLNITPSDLVNPVATTLIIPTEATQSLDSGSDIPEQHEQPIVTTVTEQNKSSNQPNSDNNIRKSSRATQLTSRLKGFQYILPGRKSAVNNVQVSAFQTEVLHALSDHHPDFIGSMFNVIKEHEPYTFKQTQQDPRWIEAMSKEITALEENQTWELVPLPNGHKAIGSKWVYRIKYKSDGSVERFKARLVAKGFNQVKDKDYKHTFSPVAKFTTVRALLALTAIKD
ncbi:uncharacterized protein LOC141642784 [Silene latifolia]|uniref:uncharacterized protein LOC141642784 n=1 Tax=Silene latifolia TaxID=37657 RepID=UPI003D782F18